MWTKPWKIRTNNGELLLLSVGVPSLEAELAMSKGIKRYFNYMSSPGTSHAKNNLPFLRSIRGLGFLTNTEGFFVCYNKFFFNYVKVPCKHLGWKVIRQSSSKYTPGYHQQ